MLHCRLAEAGLVRVKLHDGPVHQSFIRGGRRGGKSRSTYDALMKTGAMVRNTSW